MKAAWCELTMLSYSYATLPGKQVKGSRKTSAVSSCLSGLMFHMTLVGVHSKITCQLAPHHSLLVMVHFINMVSSTLALHIMSRYQLHLDSNRATHHLCFPQTLVHSLRHTEIYCCKELLPHIMTV